MGSVIDSTGNVVDCDVSLHLVPVCDFRVIRDFSESISKICGEIVAEFRRDGTDIQKVSQVGTVAISE